MLKTSLRLPGLLLLPAITACLPGPTHEANFAVPREGLRSFLDIPWPSDIDRRDDGGLDLQSFPNPSRSDTLEDYLSVIAETRGYATNGVVYLGVGAELDRESLPASADASRAADATLQFVNVDADSPTFGQRLPTWFKIYRGDLFVPDGGLAVWPVLGYVLEPGTTYAVVLRAQARTLAGETLTAPPDLTAILAPEAPSEPALKRAHDIFAPLRRLWDAEDRDVADIALATVFTTQHPTAVAERAAASLEQRNSAVIDWIAEADDYDAHDTFWVFEGELTLDQFQTGTPPYNSYGSGGFELGPDGVPLVQRRETMPFALTVPRGEPPAQGWPIALIAHGTGGWHRSFVGSRQGDESTFLARAGYAALGIPQPIHYGREGYSPGLEELAAFNFVNPVAGRTGWLQSALESVMLARYLRDGHIPLGRGSRRIPIDGTRTAFFGHSQGGASGALALGLDRDIKVAVLSGTGGGVAASMVEKTSPVVIASTVRLVLSLPDDYEIDHFNPVMTLLQTYVEQVDPLNYGALVYRGSGARELPAVLMTSGWIDTYTPVFIHAPLAAALGLPLVEPIIEMPEVYQLMGRAPLPGPVSDNLSFAGRSTTGGLAQFFGLTSDGHFVVFRNAVATRTVREFFQTCRQGSCAIDPRP